MDIQKRVDLSGSFRNVNWQSSTIAGLRLVEGATNFSAVACRWNNNEGWGIIVQGPSNIYIDHYTVDTGSLTSQGFIFFDVAGDSDSRDFFSLSSGLIEVNGLVNDALIKLGRQLTFDDTQFTVNIDGMMIAVAAGQEEKFDLMRVYPAEGTVHRSVAMIFNAVNARQHVRDWWTGIPQSPPSKDLRVLSGTFAGDANGAQYDYTLNASPAGSIAAPIGAVATVSANDSTVPKSWSKHTGAAVRLAQGTLTMDTQPIVGDTFDLDTKKYTFRDILAADGDIAIGGSLAQAKLNLVAAIDLSGVAGTDYDTAMTRHTTVHVNPFIGDNVVISARSGGTAGNSIATTETFDAVTNIFDAATLGMTTSGAGEAGWVGLQGIITESDASRGDATAHVTGYMIFNTDDGAPNWSDGTNWVDATGSTT